MMFGTSRLGETDRSPGWSGASARRGAAVAAIEACPGRDRRPGNGEHNSPLQPIQLQEAVWASPQSTGLGESSSGEQTAPVNADAHEFVPCGVWAARQVVTPSAVRPTVARRSTFWRKVTGWSVVRCHWSFVACPLSLARLNLLLALRGSGKVRSGVFALVAADERRQRTRDKGPMT